MRVADLVPGTRFRFLDGCTHSEPREGWVFIGMSDEMGSPHAVADDGSAPPMTGCPRGMLFDPDDPVEVT